MKILFALVLFVCAFLPSAHADIPAPKPTVITVSNLAAFPDYRFSYRVDGQQDIKAIPDGKPFTAHRDVDLLVKSGSETEQRWEQIRYDWKGAKIALKIQGVTQEGKTIKVTYTSTGKDPVPGKKTAAAAAGQSLPLFGLTAIGACGLVIFARRRSSAR